MAKKKRPTTKQITNALTQQANRPTLGPRNLLGTGSTLLNLALTNKAEGGFVKGKYFWMVGDSSSGKTWLMLTCLAEASIDPNFDGYRFIYDNVEDGALMDMAKYFGKRMASRLEPPSTDADGNPVHSMYIEDFYYNAADALDQGPCIYLLDSMDSLGSKYADKKFDEAKKAHQKPGDSKAKGSFGDGKAKFNSENLRGVVNKLTRSGSILIILSQTRDNIDGGMFDPKQVASGGKALKFYATCQLWSSVGSAIKKTVRGKEVKIGINCRVAVKKNRLTGKDRTVTFPLYYSVGIDDIGGMVDWMCDWKFWKRSRQGAVDASTTWDVDPMPRESLIKYVEEHDLRGDLCDVLEESWREIEEKLALDRKSKYA